MERVITSLIILAVAIGMGDAWLVAADTERELRRLYVERDMSSECGNKPADIVFVLDESGSIYGPDFQKQLKFVSDIVKSFDSEFNKTHFGVITFADDTLIHFQLTDHHSFGPLNSAIRKIGQRRGRTYTHLALREMWQNMFSPTYSRNWVPHIAIVITDGESHYPQQTADEADLARDQGITLFAIGVGDRIVMDELKAIGNSPSVDYVFNVESYSALEGIREKLSIKTCQVTTPEPSTTTTTTAIPTTTLPPPPSIPKCTARGPIDVLFALPDQAGVGDTELALDFVASVSDKLEVGEEQALVGLTPRACDDIAGAISLGENDMLEGLRNSLDQRKLTSTETWRHLRHMHTAGMDPASGSREESVRFGVLVIDNKSTDKQQAIRQADRAKEKGMHLITVKVGDYPDEDEVTQIASSSDDVLTASDYNTLDGVVEELIDRFCDVIRFEDGKF